jgi:DNA (cytosine-5)-methyltransferase 1
MNEKSEGFAGHKQYVLGRAAAACPLSVPQTTLTQGSLFAGIGGIDLGFLWAGIQTVWQVEIDDYAQDVLAKWFPEAERLRDVRECGSHNLRYVDIISGGFPCTDICPGGKRAGIGGPHSRLWRDMARVVGELRPRYVVVENSADLLVPGRGMDEVLGDLAALGFDAEWSVLSACSMGAPHMRKRVFILAYPNGAEFGQLRREQCEESREEAWHLYRQGLEPPIPRVAYGVPHRMDRRRGCGNAVVPQIAEFIGRRIVEMEQQLCHSADRR